MNNLKTIILIAGILVAGVAFNSVAQETPASDEQLETIYSYKHDKVKHKETKSSHKSHVKHGVKAHKINKHIHRHKAYKHKVKSQASAK